MFDNDKKLKIFVSSYACEPGKGSEIGVGWHWVLEMSKYFELWVMTRANNQKPIEAFLKENPKLDNGVHWIYYDCPNYIKRFKKQMRGVRIYYTFWQHMSNKVIKDVMQANDIKIFHLLTYGNAIWDVSNFGQKQFFIWGPTGGVDTISQEFAKHYTFKSQIIERVRRIVISSLKINPFFYKKCRNADLIFCKSNSTMNTIPKKYKNKAMLFTDVAMDMQLSNINIEIKNETENLTFISVGRLDGWRGFDLLIEAFSLVIKDNHNLTLKIIGEGTEKKHLEQLVIERHLEGKVILTGQISMEEYQQEMQNCDAVVNACLKEGGVTNAFDCMKWGKPLLCIDTGGYTRNFDSSCAIILNHGKRNDVIQNLKDGMIQLKSSSVRKQMSVSMLNKGSQITWEIKGENIRDEILNFYKESGSEL